MVRAIKTWLYMAKLKWYTKLIREEVGLAVLDGKAIT